MYYLFIMRQVICWFVYIGNWFVYIAKNPRFRAFLDSNVHTRLAIVTENELGLAFPPRNLPKKIQPDPSTFYLVIMVTNRQTDRQTNAGKNIIPRFRGDKNPKIRNGQVFLTSISDGKSSTKYFSRAALAPSIASRYSLRAFKAFILFSTYRACFCCRQSQYNVVIIETRSDVGYSIFSNNLP